MSSPEMFCLALAAAAAGAINAVAGGGTLVTFPALLFFGTPPIVANATSTMALFLGTSSSLYGYRRHLGSVGPWLWRFVPISIAGGVLGAILLTYTKEKAFAKLVPFLILFATLLLLAQPLVRRLLRFDNTTPAPSAAQFTWGPFLFQFGVAVYGGYFGAGIGILMLASLGLMGLTNIHEMNTLKTVLASLINLVAAIWFTLSGWVDWSRAGVMTLGALVGYYLGAHYSQRISQARVRQIITAIGFILTAVTFYAEFLSKR